MRTRHAFALLLLLGSDAHAQTPGCTQWESKLKAELDVARSCKPQYQRCLDLGPTNPMRELNYCRNLLNTCESLDGPIEDAALKQQVEQYKKQCS
ncbi:MAG TPA: hypothetical protein VFV71_08645 [Burkholderiales bacterium]|nr:hypothetical protein [Burkholderiales bacterium]